MKHRQWLFFLSALVCTSSIVAVWKQSLPSFQTGYLPSAAALQESSHDWPMFHRDEKHTGVTDGAGDFFTDHPPGVRWQYPVFDQPRTADDLALIRWTTTFPLGDLDGDGTVEIVITTPDGPAYLNGQPMPHRVIALKDHPGQSPPLDVMWVYTPTIPIGSPGLDTYSPALGDADMDGKLDVIFTGRDGYVRALKGTTGQVLWEFFTDRITEAGPTIADLDGDGTLEVVVVTDCQSGVECPDHGHEAQLFVLPITAAGMINTPLWSLTYPYKMDSAVPAIADLDPNDGEDRQAIIVGTWGGELVVTWRDASGQVVINTLDLHDLDPSVPLDETPVIRTSPLVWDFGEGPTVVFGWLPTDLNAADARISAVGLEADMHNGTVSFIHRWTRDEFDAWKSSPALVPQPAGPPLIVMGTGLGIGPPPVQSGSVGQCVSGQVSGGIVALDWQGEVAWSHDFGHLEGNVRASPAIGDLDGNGVMDVVLPVGCYGGLHIYDGVSGQELWSLQLGPRAQNSPSLGDIDGDSTVEMVLGSYDGKVWALDRGARILLPLVLGQ